MKKINKRFVVTLLSVTILLIATGCQNNKAITSEETIQDNTGTRIIHTVNGDVEIPVNPKRVIATYGMGDLIALGVKPVATYDATGTAYETEVADLPVWKSFEAENIMSYDPDLIIVVNQEQYDKVSKIAPTIMLPFKDMTMEERVTFLGEVLNKQDEAKKALSDFKEKVTASKKELENKGIMSKTFSIFEDDSKGGGVWVYGDKWGRGGDLFYSQLGFSAPKVIQDEIIKKDQYRQVSMEAISNYSGDYIVFSGELGSLSDNPVWNSLPAVKAGRVITIDFTLFYDIDLFSSNVQLDYVMNKLRAMDK